MIKLLLTFTPLGIKDFHKKIIEEIYFYEFEKNVEQSIRKKRLGIQIVFRGAFSKNLKRKEIGCRFRHCSFPYLQEKNTRFL